jgi:hypothetical protein
MTRLNAFSSALLALLASLTLAACGGTVDFTIEKDLVIDTTVNSGKDVKSFDLAASAGSAWKQRSHISSVHVTQAEALVTAVNAANTATQLTGEVWLLPDGATDKTAAGSVKVGDWTAGEDVVIGNTISITLGPDLDGFVRNAFNGSGKFSVFAEGAPTGAGGSRVACTLHVVLGAKLKWKP